MWLGDFLRNSNIVWLESKRDFESSIGQFFVEELNEEFSLRLKVGLGVIVKSNLEDVFSTRVDSNSLSDNLERNDQILKDLIVDTSQSSRVRDLLVIVALSRDDSSLGDGEEVDLLVFRELVSILSNGIDILGLERIWKIDDSAAKLATVLFNEGIFKGLGDFDLRELILLFLGLSG